jgi:16S rRNA (guanine527-N7)-methyltransferase
MPITPSQTPRQQTEPLQPEQSQLLLQHLQAVLDQNKHQNLTRINTLKDGALLHIEDSLTALPEVTAAPAGPLLDIGSGAGYPGIPLALATGRATTLLEANRNKAHFLRDFLRAQKLDTQITVVSQRVEDYARSAAESYAVATARAVAELAVLLEYAAPLLFTGGQLITYKAQPSEAELEQSKQAAPLLGFDPPKLRPLNLSDGKTARTILTYTKTTTPTLTLTRPRRPGMAKKHPLGKQ